MSTAVGLSKQRPPLTSCEMYHKGCVLYLLPARLINYKFNQYDIKTNSKLDTLSILIDEDLFKFNYIPTLS